MCLGVPGLITEIHQEAGLPVGTVDFGGLRRSACLSCTPEAEVGDYVIVHVGFAITVVDQAEAERTLDVLRAIDASDGSLRTELGAADPAAGLVVDLAANAGGDAA